MLTLIAGSLILTPGELHADSIANSSPTRNQNLSTNNQTAFSPTTKLTGGGRNGPTTAQSLLPPSGAAICCANHVQHTVYGVVMSLSVNVAPSSTGNSSS